ncbi:ABC transporter substrate-binding protein [Candidimonas sp. SYP-B2681]|uniref:Bug family tripartite tricarboxylate transporter substrate binding protein n=1 Tax=Candidimonas sp. SYP-B2681 TaxID=2497686 RepID=UPI000F874643|nr:tripartite tricarboxylate transporter substrate-binding protein [Candidimonas sp. SYP-B2681]RTZ41649.1 ABC transporter substrate-binding protein [Candidimonas sp. SYP-B2681]
MRPLPSLLFLAFVSLSSAGTAWAQDYPARAIRLIIPFPPGGTTDMIGRTFADEMGKVLGQAVVVENKGGASGAIGAEAIAKAAPDGYTIGLSSASGFAIHPACNPKVSYHPIQDFAPITRLASSPHVILVNPGFPAKNYQEFLAMIQAHPEKYEYATSGTCGSGHMLGEQFKLSTGVSMMHVPYRGAGPAANDVLAGHVPILIDALPSATAHIKDGKLRPIVLASANRVASVPDVPTFGEVGVNEANEAGWYGLVAPAGTPDQMVQTIYRAVLKAIESPALQERLRAAGAMPGGTTPSEHAAEISKSFERMKVLVKAKNITQN